MYIFVMLCAWWNFDVDGDLQSKEWKKEIKFRQAWRPLSQENVEDVAVFRSECMVFV